MIIRDFYRAACVVCLAGLGASNLAGSEMTDAFRMATTYNVFVFKNFSGQNTDIEGGLAAGGRVTLTSYSVGSARMFGPVDVSKPPVSAAYFAPYGSDVLVAAGGLTANNGYANGYIYAADPHQLSGFTNYGLDSRLASPIPFTVAETQLEALSASLAELGAASTDACTVSGSQVTCTATRAGITSFTLDASKLASNSTFNFVDATRGQARIILNVTGNVTAFSIGGWNLQGIASNQLLVNVTGVQSLNMSTSVFGSVLAPNSNVTSQYTRFEGNLIANSYSGTTEFHQIPYSATLPDLETTATPEPVTLTMAGAGLLALVALARRRRA